MSIYSSPDVIPEVIHSGDYVQSSVKELGELPESFHILGEDAGDTDFTIGIGLRVTPDGYELDKNLEKFFNYLGAEVWDPTSSDKRSLAVRDIAEQIVEDYRQSPLYLERRDSAHQIYGTIARNYATAKKSGAIDEYDDSLLHVDFVPPDMPCSGYFFTDNNGTGYRTGQFEYKDNLTADYHKLRSWEWRIGTSPGPSGFGHIEPGHLYRTPDARTFLHYADIRNPGYRTLGRMFAGAISE